MELHDAAVLQQNESVHRRCVYARIHGPRGVLHISRKWNLFIQARRCRIEMYESCTTPAMMAQRPVAPSRSARQMRSWSTFSPGTGSSDSGLARQEIASSRGSLPPRLRATRPVVPVPASVGGAARRLGHWNIASRALPAGPPPEMEGLTRPSVEPQFAESGSSAAAWSATVIPRGLAPSRARSRRLPPTHRSRAADADHQTL
jgi:hypothetical protein